MVISIVKNLFEVLTNENEIEISSVLNSTPKILSWVKTQGKTVFHSWKQFITTKEKEMNTWPSQYTKKGFSGLQRDSNPWPLRSHCSALPAELWRPIHGEQANLLSSSTRKRNETEWNEKRKWSEKEKEQDSATKVSSYIVIITARNLSEHYSISWGCLRTTFWL